MALSDRTDSIVFTVRTPGEKPIARRSGSTKIAGRRAEERLERLAIGLGSLAKAVAHGRLAQAEPCGDFVDLQVLEHPQSHDLPHFVRQGLEAAFHGRRPVSSR